MGILTSWNTDTLEGLESRFSVEIRRILTELPDSTELELGKLCRTRTDSGRAGSLPALRTSPLSLSLSLLNKNELGSTIGG
jgi:hypothetical protein